MSIPKLQDYALPTTADLPANKVSWQIEAPRAALLIHDMQNYFLNFWGDNSAMVEQLIAHTLQLRERCHQLGIPVFYTAQPNEQSDADRALLNDMWGPGLNRHPEQQRIVAPLAPQEQDIVLTKWRYSAFQRSDLQARLSHLKRDQLIICGVYAHIGCLTTATDAFMRDIQAFMIGDALADFSQEEHMMALRYTAGRSGRVLNTAQVLAELGSRTPTTTWDRASLLALLLPAMDEEAQQITDEESLLDYGLDSLRVMSFATQRREEGHNVDFISLVKQPTLKNWLALLQAKS